MFAIIMLHLLRQQCLQETIRVNVWKKSFKEEREMECYTEKSNWIAMGERGVADKKREGIIFHKIEDCPSVQY